MNQIVALIDQFKWGQIEGTIEIETMQPAFNYSPTDTEGYCKKAVIKYEPVSTAAEGPNYRGTQTGGTTFVHMSIIVLRDL